MLVRCMCTTPHAVRCMCRAVQSCAGVHYAHSTLVMASNPNKPGLWGGGLTYLPLSQNPRSGRSLKMRGGGPDLPPTQPKTTQW